MLQRQQGFTGERQCRWTRPSNHAHQCYTSCPSGRQDADRTIVANSCRQKGMHEQHTMLATPISGCHMNWRMVSLFSRTCCITTTRAARLILLASLRSCCTTPRLCPPKDTLAPLHLLGPSLQEMLNKAFHAGFVPPEVNSAVVTPVFKKGDRALTSNYRPIAVTTPVMRLYAGILYH